MKKQGKISGTMVVWAMMIMILANATLSITAAQDEKIINGTNNYFGVVNENEFDSEFPDATSSHFRRVLAQVQSLTGGTANANRPAINTQTAAYRGSSPLSSNGGQGCGSDYNRAC